MTSPLSRKRLPQSVNAEALQRPKTEGVFVYLMSVVVAAVIAIGLWISASAVIAKVHLANGLRQMIDIVAASRDAGGIDHNLGTTKQDLLVVLQQMGRMTPAGDADGIKYLTNPWAGKVMVSALPPNWVRIETTIPSYACLRLIDLVAGDSQGLGIKQVEVKGAPDSWRQVYNDNLHTKLNDTEIAAGCSNINNANNSNTATVAFLFTLR